MSILTAYDKFIQQALKYGFSLWGTAKTGQKTSYHLGDDGALQKGYPKTPPRFKDNGDGTITDNATGLMWVKEPGACGGIFGTPGNPSTIRWDNALTACHVLDYAGHTDWRLCNIKELASLIDYSTFGPCMDPLFTDVKLFIDYWTSTTYTSITAFKWVIEFLDGATGWSNESASLMVRPVRLGVPKD